jgi:hypothetical protein
VNDIKDLINNYKITFESEQGEKVLEDLENRFHQNKTTFSKDAIEMAYLEGQRSVILSIKNLIKENNKK